MEHDLLDRSSGKFPGATERLKYSKRKFVFRFFKAIPALIPVSGLRGQSFFGKWNRFVQMINAIPGRNLPVLDFGYHLPKLWSDQFPHVNGNKSLAFLDKGTS